MNSHLPRQQHDARSDGEDEHEGFEHAAADATME